MTVQGPVPRVHKGGGAYGVTHDWNCPACVLENADRKLRDEMANPHRIGTKAHEKFDRERAASRWALDPRGETYWSS